MNFCGIFLCKFWASRGGGHNNDFILHLLTISKYHAEFQFRDCHWKINDLVQNSTTFLEHCLLQLNQLQSFVVVSEAERHLYKSKVDSKTPICHSGQLKRSRLLYELSKRQQDLIRSDGPAGLFISTFFSGIWVRRAKIAFNLCITN